MKVQIDKVIEIAMLLLASNKAAQVTIADLQGRILSVEQENTQVKSQLTAALANDAADEDLILAAEEAARIAQEKAQNSEVAFAEYKAAAEAQNTELTQQLNDAIALLQSQVANQAAQN